MCVFRIGELFCGAGGLGLGSKMAEVADADILHVWATDIDRDSCCTYEQNIAPQKIFPADIRKVDFNKLKAMGDVDALAFGFPCNDFSVVGKQSGVVGEFGLFKYSEN